VFDTKVWSLVGVVVVEVIVGVGDAQGMFDEEVKELEGVGIWGRHG